MYSEKDFEKLWFLYRTEGSPKGFSINSFCEHQGVAYDRFAEWLHKRQKKIVPVQIEGMPSDEPVTTEVEMPKLKLEGIC